jgi:hypothetical protein
MPSCLFISCIFTETFLKTNKECTGWLKALKSLILGLNPFPLFTNWVFLDKPPTLICKPRTVIAAAYIVRMRDPA